MSEEVRDKSTSMRKKLQINKLKLDTLLNLTTAINDNLSKNELFDIYADVLIQELRIGKLQLFTFDKEWTLAMSHGIELDPEFDPNKLTTIKDILVLSGHEDSYLNKFGVVVPVFHKSKPLAYLLMDDFDGEKIEVSPIIKHLSFIRTLTNIVIVAIENKKLYKENIRQAAVNRELELASKMQSMLFPDALPHNQSLDVDAFYKPHHVVGGDYYDFIELSKDEIAFCMADVSGKGVSAALLMSNFQANLRALIQRSGSLFDLLVELNQKVIQSAHREKYITLFIAKYHLRTRRLNYINAGHIPPLIVSKGKVTELTNGATVLGMFDELPSIQEGNLSVDPNSFLLCYTDGLIEVENSDNEAFGINRLKSTVLRSTGSDISNSIQSIYQAADNFRGDKDYPDDITLLGLRFK